MQLQIWAFTQTAIGTDSPGESCRPKEAAVHLYWDAANVCNPQQCQTSCLNVFAVPSNQTLQPNVQLQGNEAWAINPVPAMRASKWDREGHGSEKIEEAVGERQLDLRSLWWSRNAPSPKSSPPNADPRREWGKPSHHTHTLCHVKVGRRSGSRGLERAHGCTLVMRECSFWLNYSFNIWEYFQCVIFHFVLN